MNTLRMSFFLLTFTLLSCGTGWAQSAPFAGVFANESITLTLHYANGQYTGQVQLEGQTFPVATHNVDGKAIRGTYTYHGTAIPFEATLQGSTMTIRSEGELVVLHKREGQSSSNGAAMGGATQAGTTPDAPAVGEVGEAQWGLYFIPPPGWQAQKGDGTFVLGSQTEKGFILVMPHALNTLDDLRIMAAEGLHDGPRTSMRLRGATTPFGSRGLAATFEGTLEGQTATAYALSLLGPHGGATIMAAVEAASFTDAYKRHVEAIAQTLRFSNPQTAPATTQWRQTLSGARLTALSSYYSSSPNGSYIGASSETVIDLCEAGYFNYGSKHALGVDGGGGNTYNATGYAGGNNQGSGRWEITRQGSGETLRLLFHNGDIMAFALTTNEKGHTLLNDTRFYRTYANDAVAEHRPACH